MRSTQTGALWRALATAERSHRGQYRKAVPVPFLIHPLRVANIILAYRLPEEPLAVAALLHDTVEHGVQTLGEIERAFGAEVCRLVDALTMGAPNAPWRERKSAAIERMGTAAADVLTLACADKFDNLLSIRDDLARMGPSLWLRLRRTRREQAWYFSSLAGVFRARAGALPDRSLFDDFCSEVDRVFGAAAGTRGRRNAPVQCGPTPPISGKPSKKSNERLVTE